MREAQVTIPEIAMIAGTRVALGAGLGLLLADRLSEGPRKAIGWTLLLTGAVITIPLAFEVLGKARDSKRPERNRSIRGQYIPQPAVAT